MVLPLVYSKHLNFHVLYLYYFAAMSKRISLKKLNEKVEKSKSGDSIVGSSQAKGVVIGKKCPREDPSSSPNKKGKATDGPKGKKAASAPEPKKKATRATTRHTREPPLSQSPRRGARPV